MKWILVQLFWLAVLFCGGAQASPTISISNISPEMSARFEEQLKVKVERSDQFFWFEVTVKNSERAMGSLYIRGKGDHPYEISYLIYNECFLRLDPAKKDGDLIFSFGLSETKLTNSFFTVGGISGKKRGQGYQFNLKAFALDQCY